MVNEKYIMLNLDDERLDNLAEALNNKTAKKIISYLAEKEASEGDIVKDLSIPANTVNYNIKKLLEVNLIEKSSSFFWSVKGKKIPQYKVSKKTIMISPKNSSSILKVVTTLVLTGVAAYFVKIFTESNNFAPVVYEKAGSSAQIAEVAPAVVNNVNSIGVSNIWLWFLFGGIVALLIFIILNWRKL